ncbi:hypothetical protein BKA67DRAFT_656902 [Truncatella angustata]|uniref:Major facilitator superfamily (MFS) profile domain-containing protein n=1 Tax=Truncatella angustata TaxID=152316 RepID=A0A9P8UVE5_9PEZI|nr:uncharacterized protein BKA67DRAFT_656902 [Truncatella angustata]KAH6658762.1 hypothetical protein BKA67DRAFT_656902 [Truncatella angustata]
MIPPGRSRNLFLGFFAAFPPLRGSLGAVLTGIFIDSVGWKWLFILIGTLTAIITVWVMLITPKETPIDEHGRIDYIGAFSGMGSLVIFNIVCK